MADEQNELRQVNWTELLGFTKIFKSFRMSIHPSKLVLALAMVISLYAIGWVMSAAWCVVGYTARPGEVRQYYTDTPETFAAREKSDDDKLRDAATLLAAARLAHYNASNFTFQEARDTSRAVSDRIDVHFLQGAFNKAALELRDDDRPKDSREDIFKKAKENDEDYDDLLSEVRDQYDAELDNIREGLDKGYDTVDDLIKKDANLSKDDNEDLIDVAEELLDRDLIAAKLAISRRKVNQARSLKAIEGEGIFETFCDYESDCIANALKAVRYGNIFTGLQAHRNTMDGKGVPEQNTDSPTNVPAVQSSVNEPCGFVVYTLMAANGVCWLISNNLVFAIVYLLAAMAVIALFGGAIARISALEFARDERISIKQALRFSISKFPSFFCAPLFPIVLILGAGSLLMLGGLVGSIPGIGPVLMAVLFFLALLLGLGAAFLLIGLVAGGPLMYPTIAVEGSDCFDSMGRSFCYVYGKPWHTALYGLVALVYGAITYLFVRLFVYIALVATHTMVKWGMCAEGDALGENADKLDVLWTRPTFDKLFGNLSWEAMSGFEQVIAFIIGIWVFLLAAGVAAYIVSYAINSSTTIYFLLRRKVDATDLDDVYVEEEEDEQFIPPAEAAEEAPAEPAEAETETDTGTNEEPAEDSEENKDE
ncbi:MAG TPA: hypothetical protein ENL03_01795 [Phycisphaerae bacterium]|nr:hypothetical protein [Phycisphaerae bacterium]